MSTRMEQQENEQGASHSLDCSIASLTHVRFPRLEFLMNAPIRAPTVPSSNFNRDKRPKYVPPKGAPDADLIFGSK